VTSSPLIPDSPPLEASAPRPGAARAGSFRAWVMACRPATLSAAAVPVLVGSAVAYVEGGIRWGPALAALVGALLLQVGANLANDVFDYEKGADTTERLGPTRTVQSGLLSARAVRRAMVLVFALALLVGVYLTSVAGVSIVVIGLCSIAAAIAYTGGPYPLGYHGLGDLFVMLFFGFVAVCGTTFVQLGTVPALAWWASVPVGALATAILVVNNVRDRNTDVLAGKRTLAVRLGKAGGIAEYALLIGAAYLVPVALLMTRQAGAWVLLPTVTVVPALVLVRQVARNEGRALNPTLVNTAKLLFVFGLLFTIGLALGGRR
jgi:1,4-dihydroxy-2-naphthoate polyprenyltransferase